MYQKQNKNIKLFSVKWKGKMKKKEIEQKNKEIKNNSGIEFVSESPEQTANFAREFAKSLNEKKVVLLKGDLGAGKTVFTKGFVSAFYEDENVVSPTFTLQNNYKEISHFDLYRLNSYSELANIGAEEYLYSNNFCLVEWPERIDFSYFPKNSVLVEIEKLNDNKRKITIKDLN